MKKHYRFAALADIHIDLENGGKNIYFIHAEENFSRALRVIKERDCAFIISAGDQVTNASGAKAEWERYRAIIRESGYTGQIFEAMGNHEMRYAQYGGCTIEECRAEFVKYTELRKKPVILPQEAVTCVKDNDQTIIQSLSRTKTYYAYIDDRFGDAFLFLSLENGVSTNEIDNFSDEQMDWAKEMIARFQREKRRIFLIQHAPLYGFGVGDDIKNPAYEGSMRLTDDKGKTFRNNRRFYELIRENRDMIWLSGHTHVDLRDNVNYSRDGACHMLHIPSLAGSTRIRNENGGNYLDRSFAVNNAQGYIADVYEDRVVFSGIDFLDDRVFREYTYTIRK